MENGGGPDEIAGLGHLGQINAPRVSVARGRAPGHVSSPLAVSAGRDLSEEPGAKPSGLCCVREPVQHPEPLVLQVQIQKQLQLCHATQRDT